MRETTSASNVYRRKLCPGSARAEAAVIEQGNTDAADEGTLLHPFACDRRLSREHLTDKQRALLARADSADESLEAQARDWMGVAVIGDTAAPAVYRFERLEIKGPDRERLFSGESDLVRYWPTRAGALIEDFKLGFVQVPPAAHNYQLAAYAVMWRDFLELDSALVAINQPKTKGGVSLAEYKPDGIEKARRELAAIVHASEDASAPLIAGEDQCRFCRAKLHCEAYKQKFQPLALKPDAQVIGDLEPDKLKAMLEAVRFAARIADPVIAEVTRRVEEQEPGFEDWMMKDNGETKQFTDLVGAFRAVSDYMAAVGRDFTGTDFTDCTELKWTRLLELFQERTGFPKTRAQKLLLEIVNPFLTFKPKRKTPTPKDS